MHARTPHVHSLIHSFNLINSPWCRSHQQQFSSALCPGRRSLVVSRYDITSSLHVSAEISEPGVSWSSSFPFSLQCNCCSDCSGNCNVNKMEISRTEQIRRVFSGTFQSRLIIERNVTLPHRILREELVIPGKFQSDIGKYLMMTRQCFCTLSFSCDSCIQ